MAINIGANFAYQGKQPNFARDSFATKAAMKAFAETSIDEGHLSYCAEDGNMYQFKSSNAPDDTTGKWRIFKSGNQVAVTVDSAISSDSTNPVQNKIIKAELDKKMPKGGADYIATGDILSTNLPITKGTINLNGYNIIGDSGIKPSIAEDDILYIYNGNTVSFGPNFNISGCVLCFNCIRVEIDKANSNITGSVLVYGLYNVLGQYATSSGMYGGVIDNYVRSFLYDGVNENLEQALTPPSAAYVSDKYLSINSAANTYLSKNDASNTYAKKTDISTVYKFKGTKDTYSALPASGNVTGDVWNITNADSTHGIKAGDNVVWTGSDWDNLSGTVDLSAYATTSAMNTALANKVNKDGSKVLSTNDFTDTYKTKLDGIAANANNYSLPTASSSTLGGVKVGSNLAISSGVLSVKPTITNDQTIIESTGSGKNTTVKGYGVAIESNMDNCTITTGEAFDLVVNGVGVGKSIENLKSTKFGEDTQATAPRQIVAASTTGEDGEYPLVLRNIEAADLPTMSAATSSAAGKSGIVPAPGAGEQASFLRGDGTWAVPTDTKYTLPAATTTTKGGVIVGTNLSVDSTGKISVSTSTTVAKNDTKPVTGDAVASFGEAIAQNTTNSVNNLKNFVAKTYVPIVNTSGLTIEGTGLGLNVAAAEHDGIIAFDTSNHNITFSEDDGLAITLGNSKKATINDKEIATTDLITALTNRVSALETALTSLQSTVNSQPKQVVLTQAAYDALTTKDSNTIYYING